MASGKHIELSRKALVWLDARATARGIRGCEEVILKSGYVCDAAAIGGLQLGWEKSMVGTERLSDDPSDDYSFIFETKVSRQDFLKTFVNNKHLGSRLESISNFHFIVAPKKMIAVDEVPEFWGLLEEFGPGLRVAKAAKYLKTGKEQLHEFAYIILRSGHSKKFTYNIEIKPIKHPDSNLLWNVPRETINTND